jgi:hypothetical protein
MPGLSDELAGLRTGSQDLDLGPGLDKFISEALPDFTHFAVLMFLARQAKSFVSVGEVADVTGDGRSVVAAVLERFHKLGLVESSGGLLTTKYAFKRAARQAETVARLLKLWTHPRSHQTILRRLLAGGPGQ